ncbi:hypothetical protein Catovirus_1_551 [Catovirus CTV1]|uniref:Uncharacterized protein n=1 Tax=Catovirus CTV1 TaxID=1977631 RepID=A0A1V0S9Y4_9VIRU|nr:hypothetical protein Catovirus_1_551 [Catovirus CTV1]
MDQINKNINYLQNILQQYHRLNNDNDRKLFIISRNVPHNAIKFMSGKDNKFFELFKKCINGHLLKGLSFDAIIEFYSSSFIFPKDVVTYIMKNDQYIADDKKPSKIEDVLEPDDNNNVEPQEIVFDPIYDNTKLNELSLKHLRKNQKEAIDKMIQQGFTSGIHNQVMGCH